MRSDVVVVGAGPTGLALACGLRAAGVDVRVLDKAAGPAETSRALGLQPRGVEVLDRLGALGDLPDRGLPIRSVVINVDGRELASFPVGQATRLGGPRGLSHLPGRYRGCAPRPAGRRWRRCRMGARRLGTRAGS